MSKPNATKTETPPPANFLRGIIETDLAAGSLAQRRWNGSPGDATHRQAGAPDPARIRTRLKVQAAAARAGLPLNRAQ
jgi:glutaminyl-tRNA synthetase